jgi:hypothetical protein
MPVKTEKPIQPAGLRPREFWGAVGISRAGGYALPAELQPRSIKLGRSRVITERPADYLKRIAELQEAA